MVVERKAHKRTTTLKSKGTHTPFAAVSKDEIRQNRFTILTSNKSAISEHAANLKAAYSDPTATTNLVTNKQTPVSQPAGTLNEAILQLTNNKNISPSSSTYPHQKNPPSSFNNHASSHKYQPTQNKIPSTTKPAGPSTPDLEGHSIPPPPNIISLPLLLTPSNQPRLLNPTSM